MTLLPAQTKVIYETIVGFGRQCILEDWAVNSCIASARITKDILDFFKIPAQEIPYRVFVGNTAAMVRLESVDFDFDVFGKPQEGEHTMGAGFGRPANAGPGFDGHLVVMAGGSPEGRVIIDPSFDQFNRREKGIQCRAYYAWVPQNDSGNAARITFPTCEALYYKLDTKEYEESRDWWGHSGRVARTVGAIVREIYHSWRTDLGFTGDFLS